MPPPAAAPPPPHVASVRPTMSSLWRQTTRVWSQDVRPALAYTAAAAQRVDRAIGDRNWVRYATGATLAGLFVVAAGRKNI